MWYKKLYEIWSVCIDNVYLNWWWILYNSICVDKLENEVVTLFMCFTNGSAENQVELKSE